MNEILRHMLHPAVVYKTPIGLTCGKDYSTCYSYLMHGAAVNLEVRSLLLSWAQHGSAPLTCY